MQTEHLPKLLRHLAAILSSTCSTLLVKEVICCLKLCSRLLSKIQPVIVPPVSDGKNSPCPSEASKVSNCQPTGEFCVQALARSVSPLENSVVCSDEDEHNSGEFLATLRLPEVFIVTGKALPSIREEQPKSQTLLRACVSAFQECFVILVTTHLFGPGLDSQGLLQRLLVIQKESDKERQEKLEQWLWKVLADNTASSSFSSFRSKQCEEESGQSYGVKDVDLPLLDRAAEFLEAFTLACQILIDFSSFPACFVAGIQKVDITAVSQSKLGFCSSILFSSSTFIYCSRVV